jgi:HprK-related kinase A
LRNQDLTIDAGPFRVNVSTSDARFLDTLNDFYEHAIWREGPDVFDYGIRIFRPRNLRRWIRPQVLFEIDSRRPFEPHPLENAFPMFEWSLNWCIATSAHRYMMLHAGTVAFGDQALIMPGTPGSGKSTLSAALHLRGARLLSDEFGLVRPETGDLLPMPRGIPLKNASIEAILGFDPAAPLGPTYPKTRKGRVRHLRPDRESQIQQDVPAVPRWLVFPKYEAGAKETLRPLDKTEAFRQLAFNCFNYRLLGETSFRAVAQLIRQMDCYTLSFSNLERAVEQLSALASEPGPAAAGET